MGIELALEAGQRVARPVEVAVGVGEGLAAGSDDLGPGVVLLVAQPVEEQRGAADGYIVAVCRIGLSDPVRPTAVEPARRRGESVQLSWVQLGGEDPGEPFAGVRTAVPATLRGGEDLDAFGDVQHPDKIAVGTGEGGAVNLCGCASRVVGAEGAGDDVHVEGQRAGGNLSEPPPNPGVFRLACGEYRFGEDGALRAQRVLEVDAEVSGVSAMGVGTAIGGQRGPVLGDRPTGLDQHMESSWVHCGRHLVGHPVLPILVAFRHFISVP